MSGNFSAVAFVELTTYCKSFAPFRASALDHQTAALGGHPFAETMHFSSFAVIGLERPFHYPDISISLHNSSCRPAGKTRRADKEANHRKYWRKKQEQPYFCVNDIVFLWNLIR